MSSILASGASDTLDTHGPDDDDMVLGYLSVTSVTDYHWSLTILCLVITSHHSVQSI